MTDGVVADAFEKKLLADWSNGASSTGNDASDQTSLSGTPFVFYKAVRTKNGCIECHSAIQSSSVANSVSPLRTGDLIGIAKVVIP